MPVLQYLGPREELKWFPDWPRANESMPIPQTELYIIEVPSGLRQRIDTGKGGAQYLYPHPGWLADGSELLFQKMNRTYDGLELRAADPRAGASRVVLIEKRKTFVVGSEVVAAPPAYDGTKLASNVSIHERFFTPLADGKRFVWLSDRDGWRHLYLYKLDGTLLRQLTHGNFPVRQVVAIDEKAGWVYFTASAEERLYDVHLYRVDLEGSHFRRLTEGDGQHETQFSPSKQFFLDTHSNVNRSPAVELRRSDGVLLRTLSKGTLPEELHWRPPEEFIAKAADGKTDLYGVLYKPYDFDPDKKYPVIEVIYGGAHVQQVLHAFAAERFYHKMAPALAQLGFITFMVDARGTPGRSKAFQDVVFGSFGRYEIPDHVAVLRQLTAERPYMDLQRVGVFGHSMGGYFALRALLLAPDVYRVGVASAGAIDGYSYGPWYLGALSGNLAGYEYASNLNLASNLRGKLLLMHGTSDDVVPLSWTMKVIDALIRAGKPYQLALFPDRGHSVWDEHPWKATVRRFFEENLRP